LACYATEKIDDPNARKRRFSIAKAIEEFVWTPGCKPDEKRIPDFDFSEQFTALPTEAGQKANQSPTSVHLHFAGLSTEEREKALSLLERGGTSYDPETNELTQTPTGETRKRENI
jgi:hypothetical protein